MPWPCSTATALGRRRRRPSCPIEGSNAARLRGRRGRPHGRSRRCSPRCRTDLGPVTILVTSAGIESFDAVADITPEKWDHILAVNLTGTFICMQLAVADMIAEGWGRIVTISSSSAQSGAPHMAHYVASKGGVIGLTKAFAREFAGPGHHRQHHSPDHRRHARWPGRPEKVGNVPSIDVLGKMVPLGSGGDAGRHRGHQCVPVLRGRRLHHRPGHRRQRRHVHLIAETPSGHGGLPMPAHTGTTSTRRSPD